MGDFGEATGGVGSVGMVGGSSDCSGPWLKLRLSALYRLLKGDGCRREDWIVDASFDFVRRF